MTTARRLFGLEGEDLTGAESRALRGALNLERRHVVALANALRIGDREVTTALLTNWERSKARGYPTALVDALHALESAVEGWALNMAREAMSVSFGDPAILRRPLGAKRIHQLLEPAAVGLPLTAAQLTALDQGGGDFWQALADAAITRAATLLGRDGRVVRLQLDQEPDEPIRPDPAGQSARSAPW
ncbi:hypothetical protein [Phenylobacterium sp.]|uniref:hypothetical protein n=1 Tax=Phenylobacterium sp. TaxID=1871053 RepID=UPI0040367928